MQTFFETPGVDVNTRIANLGIILPLPPAICANYVPFVKEGSLLYLSGQGPKSLEGALQLGKVGDDVTQEEAYEHAKLVGLSLLAVMQDALGDLGRVRRIVKLFGMVNAVSDFQHHSKVIDGCSDLFVAVFGEVGRHARSAVGMGSLPHGITVEIEAVIAINPT